MRSLLFGLGLQLTLVALALLFDLFVLRRGRCRSVCPAGALYSLLGRGPCCGSVTTGPPATGAAGASRSAP